MASAYSSPGNYTNGVWLVSQNGKGAIVDRAHLPPVGKGYEYYWLGSSEAQAQPRLFDAMNKLGVVTDQIPTGLQQALKTGVQNLNFDELQPGLLPWQAPSSTSGYAKTISSAGNTARNAATAFSLSGLFGQTGLWAGIGMSILGAVLVLFGIVKLSGRDPTAMAKRVIP